MRGFKHVDKDIAEGFRTGASIQVATHAHYRSMEGERADPYEGMSVGTHDPVVIKGGSFRSPRDTYATAVGAKFGLRLPAGKTAYMLGNVIGEAVPDSYIFCCSSQPDNRLIGEGKICFEVVDVEQFAQRLCSASKALLEPRVAAVSYRKTTFDLVREPGIKPNPFMKNNDFAWEREIRIVWKSLEGPPPVLRLRCPEISSLILPVGEKR